MKLNANPVVIGSATRNTVRGKYVDGGLPMFSFDFEERSIRHHNGHRNGPGRVLIGHGDRAGEVIEPGELMLAIVEKAYDVERDLVVFFCLGVRGDLSWAATEYLVRNWAFLESEYGESEDGGRGFALCLGYPAMAPESYLDEYVEPRLLSAVPE